MNFRTSHAQRRGFTLVELLVVIAIIGVLVALLLPAVQAAREAARRVQCINQLRQIALACNMHEGTHRFFPSGGWSKEWTADPNRGVGKDQPGSWQYNILPYMEEQAAHNLGSGDTLNSATHRQAMEQLHSTPISTFYCPSRRQPIATKHGWISVYNASTVTRLPAVAKSDYAANGGDGKWSAGDNPPFSIPRTYAAADTTHVWTTVNNNPVPRNPFAVWINGIMYHRSEVRIQKIKDGTAHTYLAGEKYVNPDDYTGFSGSNGGDYGENQSCYTGFEWDNTRLTYFDSRNLNESLKYEPLRDTPGENQWFAFGSAHTSGFNIALCDGSVWHVPFGVDRETHRRLGNRNDGLPTDISAF